MNDTWTPDDVLTPEEIASLPPAPESDFRIGRGHVPVKAGDGRRTKSRFAMQPLQGKPSRGMPPFDHPAIVNGTTIYPSTVRDVDHHVLKGGENSAKIGGRILKGKWKGFRVYTLTLEERATCPDSCPLWRSCYGSGMHLAIRYRHGPELEAELRREIAVLASEHPSGFAVRLHVLGDFYSIEYVEMWRQLLAMHRPLHIFGFTARWERCDPIGQALLQLAHEQWDRFAMRFSNAPIETCSTINIDHPGQRPQDAVICPAQIGKTESCSSCALCFQSNRRIAFLKH